MANPFNPLTEPASHKHFEERQIALHRQLIELSGDPFPIKKKVIKTAIEILVEFTGTDIHLLHSKNRIIMAMEAYHAQFEDNVKET